MHPNMHGFPQGTRFACCARDHACDGTSGRSRLLCTPRCRAQLRTVTYAAGFSSPVGFEQDPSDPANQYVVEQRGVIRLIRNGAVQATPFLDISSLVLCCGERGLLGLAFPPNFGASGRFYVNSAGVILKIVGAQTVPSVPTNFRIVR
jgi:hypothetical protein